MGKVPLKTLRQLEHQLARATSTKDKVGILNQLANIVQIKDFNRAISLCKEALALAQEEQLLHGIAESSYNLAFFYSVLVGDNTLALEYAESAIRYYRQIDDSIGEAWALNLLGGIYIDLGENITAEEYLNQSLKIAIDVDNNKIVSSVNAKLGKLCKNVARYDEAIIYYQKSLDVRLINHDKLGESSVLNNMGIVYFLSGDYAKAMHYLLQSLNIKKTMDNKHGISSALNNIANIYLKFSDFENALVYLNQSLAIKEEIGNQRGIAATLNNIGGVLTEFKKYNEALKLHNSAFALYAELHEPQKTALTINLIGMLQINEGHIQKGLHSLLEGHRIRNESHDIHGLTSSYYNLAKAYKIIGDYTNAIEYALKGIECCLTINNIHDLSEHYLGVADIYKENQHFDLSLEYSQKAIEISTSLNDIHNLYSAYECAAISYEKLGNFHEAIRNFKKYIEFKEQVLNLSIYHKTNSLLVQFDTERMQHENEILRLKADESEKQAEFYNLELQMIALHLVEKNEFLKQVKSLIQQNVSGTESELKKLVSSIESNVAAKEEWQTFKQKFDRAHDEFIQRLSKGYPQLTPMELKVAALLRIQMENKDIANLLYASVRTIEGHRLNIRKKLGLGLKDNLSGFLASW